MHAEENVLSMRKIQVEYNYDKEYKKKKKVKDVEKLIVPKSNELITRHAVN